MAQIGDRITLFTHTELPTNNPYLKQGVQKTEGEGQIVGIRKRFLIGYVWIVQLDEGKIVEVSTDKVH